MKGNYREKHCFTKTINGIEHFFAAYNGQSVEIDKDIYDCLRQSYNREWAIERKERRHRGSSYEHIVEDIESLDRHGRIPFNLICSSAEDVCMDALAQEDYHEMTVKLNEALDFLSEEEYSILMTYVNGSEDVTRLGIMFGVTKQDIYLRRKIIAKKIQKYLMEEKEA